MSKYSKWQNENRAAIPVSSNEFETPQAVYDHFDNEFSFEWDLACRKTNVKCNNGLFVEDVDSLTVDWHKLSKGWLWCNPPYSPLRPWIEKAQQEFLKGAKICMLVPPFLGSAYYSTVIPSEIRLIKGRIKFIGADGVPMKANTNDSCLLVFGPPVIPKLTYIEVPKNKSTPKNGDK